MNKFKSIFCAVMLFMVCAIMCVGCSFGEDNLPSGSDSDSKQITISLTEAESVIYDALQIQAGQINRDAFKKWGEFEGTSTVRVVNSETNELVAGQNNSVYATIENGNYNYVFSASEMHDYVYNKRSMSEDYTVNNIQDTYVDSIASKDNIIKLNFLPNMM